MNSSSVVSGSRNLIGPGSSGGLSPKNNLLDVSNLLLGTLGQYGSLAYTIPLLPGSPAIGAGMSIAGITTDERGVTRPSTDPDIGWVSAFPFSPGIEPAAVGCLHSRHRARSGWVSAFPAAVGCLHSRGGWVSRIPAFLYLLGDACRVTEIRVASGHVCH